MSVVDSSALMALAFGEDDAAAMRMAMTAESAAMSAATLVEAAIVVGSRLGPTGQDLLMDLVARLGIEVVPFDNDQARAAVVAWNRFGKGRHPAALNLGDCYSYALARVRDEPLLFKGDDFTQTDVRSALER